MEHERDDLDSKYQVGRCQGPEDQATGHSLKVAGGALLGALKTKQLAIDLKYQVGPCRGS
jgi:hypothetical protein